MDCSDTIRHIADYLDVGAIYSFRLTNKHICATLTTPRYMKTLEMFAFIWKNDPHLSITTDVLRFIQMLGFNAYTNIEIDNFIELGADRTSADALSLIDDLYAYTPKGFINHLYVNAQTAAVIFDWVRAFLSKHISPIDSNSETHELILMDLHDAIVDQRADMSWQSTYRSKVPHECRRATHMIMSLVFITIYILTSPTGLQGTGSTSA